VRDAARAVLRAGRRGAARVPRALPVTAPVLQGAGRCTRAAGRGCEGARGAALAPSRAQPATHRRHDRTAAGRDARARRPPRLADGRAGARQRDALDGPRPPRRAHRRDVLPRLRRVARRAVRARRGGRRADRRGGDRGRAHDDGPRREGARVPGRHPRGSHVQRDAEGAATVGRCRSWALCPAARGVPEAGRHRVVWWDPATLALDVQESVGLAQQKILAVDERGVRAEEGVRAHAAWQAERARVRTVGEAPSLRVLTATEHAAIGAVPAAEVAVESVAASRPRPHGKRFGTLVHAVLAAVELDAGRAAVADTAALQGRLLGATAEEVEAAIDTAVRALAHPLLRRAA